MLNRIGLKSKARVCLLLFLDSTKIAFETFAFAFETAQKYLYEKAKLSKCTFILVVNLYLRTILEPNQNIEQHRTK